LFVDTTYIPRLRSTFVAAGASLQAAVDAAQPGTRLILQKNATFEGPIVLPPKSGADYIYVETEDFLTPGRVDPKTEALAKIVTVGAHPAVIAGPGSHHYRFVGVDCLAPSQAIDTLVLLGDSESPDLAAQPHHIVLDRCWVHGDPTLGGKRGVSLQGGYQAVVDCHVSDWKGVGQDTQAIAGWNGAGPFKITNNYLEGAGENILFGGAPVRVTGLIPSDIEIRGNHISKPLAWKNEAWSIKNLLELKLGQRILISDNLLENNWAQSQAGFAVLFTVRNQTGSTTWATLADVTFQRNELRNSTNGFNLMGIDNESGVPTVASRRLLIAHNLITQIAGDQAGILFQILSGYEDVQINHNTCLNAGSTIVADYAPNPRFIFTNNIAQLNQYGVFGSGVGSGTACLEKYFPGAVFTANALQGDPANAPYYPPGNYFPATLEAVGFVDLAGGDLRLEATSPYHNAATDGTDIGAYG